MMSDVAETNPVFDMIQHAIDKDYNKANDVFGNMMTVKMSELLDQEKVKLADQIYNDVAPEDEDEEDDQLELDLETEDGDEEEENGDDEAEDEDLPLEDDDEE